METGSFGGIVFEVSSDHIKTWDGFSRSMKAGFAVHEVAAGKPKLEATGMDLARIGFSVRLDVQFCKVLDEIESMAVVLTAQEPQVLVIGGRPLGRYVLTEIDEKRRHTDGAGRVLVAGLDLKFQEWN